MPLNEHLHVRELTIEVQVLDEKCAKLEQEIRDKDRKILKLENEILEGKCKPSAKSNGFIKCTDIPKAEWKELLKRVN